jgi:hypothetical protein
MSRREARRARARVLLPRLLQLYRQQGAWVFSEPRHDTRALLAWGPDTVVLSFRGSASVENLRTDAALALATHPPRRHARMAPALRRSRYDHMPGVSPPLAVGTSFKLSPMRVSAAPRGETSDLVLMLFSKPLAAANSTLSPCGL